MLIQLFSYFFPSPEARAYVSETPHPWEGELEDMMVRQRRQRAERIARDRVEHEQRQRKEAEANHFLARGLETLATAHSEALQKLGAAPSPAELREMDSFIARGQKALCQQGDLLFGTDTIDHAIRSCGYGVVNFRSGNLD